MAELAASCPFYSTVIPLMQVSTNNRASLANLLRSSAQRRTSIESLSIQPQRRHASSSTNQSKLDLSTSRAAGQTPLPLSEYLHIKRGRKERGLVSGILIYMNK